MALSMMPLFSSIKAFTVMKTYPWEVLNGATLEVPGIEIRKYIVENAGYPSLPWILLDILALDPCLGSW